MWYGIHEKLSSALFTHENSARGEAPPYQEICDGDFDTVRIQGFYGMAEIWKIVGYTESPPFPARGYEAVVIMFEDRKTFEKKWWHYSKV